MRKSFGTQNPITIKIDSGLEAVISMDFTNDSKKLVCATGAGDRSLQIYNMPKNKNDKGEMINTVKSFHTSDIISLSVYGEADNFYFVTGML